MKRKFILGLAVALLVPNASYAVNLNNGWKLNNKAKSEAKAYKFNDAINTYTKLAEFWKTVDWSKNPNTEQDYIIALRNAEQLRTYGEIYVERPANKKGFTNAKLEPISGCYIGAYAEAESNFSAADYFEVFPKLVGKKVASYLIYVPYGTDISTYSTHFSLAKENNVSIELALEPHKGLSEVQDNAYLENFSKTLGEFGTKVFLRFANEMNDTNNAWHKDGPQMYKEKFKIVASKIHKNAPNVAMVWAPNNFPFTTIDSYYPGDESVDWVGLSAYAVNQPEVDPLEQGVDRRNYSSEFDYVYNKYSAKKPIMLSEGAASYYDVKHKKDITNRAANDLREFYTTVPRRYPRVKALFYWSSNDPNTGKFQLSKNQTILNTYKEIISSPYYLSDMDAKGGISFVKTNETVLKKGEEKLSAFVKCYEPNITKVVYSIDGVKIGEATQKPYEIKYDFSKITKEKFNIKIDVYNGNNLLFSKEQGASIK